MEVLRSNSSFPNFIFAFTAHLSKCLLVQFSIVRYVTIPFQIQCKAVSSQKNQKKSFYYWITWKQLIGKYFLTRISAWMSKLGWYIGPGYPVPGWSGSGTVEPVPIGPVPRFQDGWKIRAQYGLLCQKSLIPFKRFSLLKSFAFHQCHIN